VCGPRTSLARTPLFRTSISPRSPHAHPTPNHAPSALIPSKPTLALRDLLTGRSSSRDHAGWRRGATCTRPSTRSGVSCLSACFAHVSAPEPVEACFPDSPSAPTPTGTLTCVASCVPLLTMPQPKPEVEILMIGIIRRLGLPQIPCPAQSAYDRAGYTSARA